MSENMIQKKKFGKIWKKSNRRRGKLSTYKHSNKCLFKTALQYFPPKRLNFIIIVNSNFHLTRLKKYKKKPYMMNSAQNKATCLSCISYQRSPLQRTRLAITKSLYRVLNKCGKIYFKILSLPTISLPSSHIVP